MNFENTSNGQVYHNDCPDIAQKENFIYNVARILIDTDRYWEHNNCVIDCNGDIILLNYNTSVRLHSIINYHKGSPYLAPTETVMQILHYNPIENRHCNAILFISNQDLAQARELAEQYKTEL